MNRSLSAVIAARTTRPPGSRAVRPALRPVVSTRTGTSSQVAMDGSVSRTAARVSQNELPWTRNGLRRYMSWAMSAPAAAVSSARIASMSAGTGTWLVASRPTIVTGTPVARTAATASGSTPKFHSTMSDGDVVSMSMLPGASIVPPIVWIPARFVANAGSLASASWRFVHGPRGTAVIGSPAAFASAARRARRVAASSPSRDDSPSTAGSVTP